MAKPYLTTEWHDEETGATGYLVIHNMANGFAAGGIRMREGMTKKEVARLAEIMSLKMAGLGMDIGGAKGGIDFPPHHPNYELVLKKYLAAHLPFVKEQWLTSEDMGTREEDIVKILNEFGVATSVQSYIDKSSNRDEILVQLGKVRQANEGGTPITDLVTGYGISVVTIEGLNYLGKKLAESTASIQGFGSVGASTAKYLDEKGVKVVAVSDIEGVIYAETGLDIPLLLANKNKRGDIDRTNLPAHYEYYAPEKWVEIEADVLIPCAIADVIREDNVSSVKTSLIVEGANIPVTKEAEAMLFEKDIFVIPDFIANSGGAGLFVAILHGNVEGSPEAVFEFLHNQLAATSKKLLEIATDKQIVVRQAAEHL